MKFDKKQMTSALAISLVLTTAGMLIFFMQIFIFKGFTIKWMIITVSLLIASIIVDIKRREEIKRNSKLIWLLSLIRIIIIWLGIQMFIYYDYSGLGTVVS